MTDRQKAQVQFHGNWRQVRIFTSDFSEEWYLRLLSAVVKPFSEAYSTTQFWFTRYVCNANEPAFDDRGDTDFSALPSAYLDNGIHRSLRLRFLPQDGEERFLQSLLKPSFWYSRFLNHDELKEFGGPRFCASSREEDKSYRADLMAKILHAHSLFVLDCIAQDNDDLTFETMQSLDRPSLDSFKGIHHLLCNVIGMKSGDIWPTLRLNPADNQFYPI